MISTKISFNFRLRPLPRASIQKHSKVKQRLLAVEEGEVCLNQKLCTLRTIS